MCALEFSGITKRFHNNTVLKSVTFTVNAGEVALVMGENGAGKTTLVRAALDLTRPTEGTITYDSHAIGQVRDKVSVVFDEPALYPSLSGRSNVRFLSGVKNLTANPVAELLSDLGMTADFLALRSKKYSMGQRRKVAVCAALIRRPQYLFMDEPTTGLDPNAWQMVRAATLKLCRENGAAIILTGQNLASMEGLIDKLVILKGGEAIFSGTIDDIKSQCKPTLVVKTDYGGALEMLAAYPQTSLVEKDGISVCEICCQDVCVAKTLMQSILDRGITIKGIEVRQPTLEEVFSTVKRGDSWWLR